MVKIFLEFSDFGCGYLREWELVDLMGMNFAILFISGVV